MGFRGFFVDFSSGVDIMGMEGDGILKQQTKGTGMAVVAAVCWGLVANAGEFLVTVKGIDAVSLTSLRLIVAGGIFLLAAKVGGTEVFRIWHLSDSRRRAAADIDIEIGGVTTLR